MKHREENDFESINHRLFSFMRMRDFSKLTISLIVMFSSDRQLWISRMRLTYFRYRGDTDIFKSGLHIEDLENRGVLFRSPAVR